MDKEWGLAKTDILEFLQKNPQHPEINFLLGGIYMKEGNPKMAEPCFRVSTQGYTPQYLAYFRHGLSLYELGIIDTAIIQYKKSLQLNPDQAKAYFHLGIAQLGWHEWEDAVGSLKQCLDLGQHQFNKIELSQVHSHLAFAYTEIEDFKSATEHANLALFFTPYSPNVIYLSGLIHEKQGSLEEALVEYDIVIQESPDHLESRLGRARIHLNQAKQYTTFTGDNGSRRPEKTPLSNSEHFPLFDGMTYEKKDLLSKAYRDIKYVQSLSPELKESYLLEGNMYMNLYQFAQAESCYNFVLELDPLVYEANFKLGKIAFINGRFEESINWFNQASHLRKPDKNLFLALGNARLGLGDREGACEDFQNAINKGSAEAVQIRSRFCP